MTTTQNTIPAHELTPGVTLHRVIKTPGRTRVFEDAINEKVLTVEPHEGYLHITLEAAAPARSHAINIPWDRPVQVACEACHAQPAGHGHFALYCEPCSNLPY